MAKKGNSPLVSVLIPAYNCGEYIEHAILSILDQTYINLEIIAIDDGSTDDTWSKLQKIKDGRLKLLKNKKNLKIVGTLNKGIRLAQGKYIARMDGDDFSYADRIEKQVQYLELNDDVVVVGGAIEVCDANMNVINRRKYPIDDTAIRAKIFRYNPFAHPAVMIRKSAIDDTGYELNWAEDYDMWFRLGRVGMLANLTDTVLKLRTHSASVSQSKVTYQEKLTLYIRMKAIFEYGYVMTLADKIYFFAQLIGIYVVPAKIKFYIFSKIRGTNKV